MIVDKCPVTANEGEAAYSEVVDHYFGSPGKWTYLRDRDTGHLWMSPRPADYEIPALYVNYYTHGNAPDASGTRLQRAQELILHRRLGYPLSTPPDGIVRLLSTLPTLSSAAVMEALKLSARAPGRLLDFGCGDGSLMSRLRRVGWKVSGVEQDPKAADSLRARLGLDVRPSLDDFADRAGEFDVITASHVIEHTADPVSTLRALRRFLNQEGSLIIVTPNANSLGARAFGRFWRGLEPPRHFNVFTPKSLRYALEQAGYLVEELTTETRMARRLFWVSALARRGVRQIELTPRSERLTKWGGYGFQLIEALCNVLGAEMGEEIYCRSSPTA
ncbi:MAG TPA: class I SAM-dependent methyltransferase [Steroidobacteraceae bacterium]